MKVGFATFEKLDNRPVNSVGSSRIRARWLWKYWEDAEEYHIGREYDAIIYQKVYWEEMMRSFKGKQIVDICDPDWLEGKDVMRYINMADACVTSTERLAEYIRNFTDHPVVCIPDRLDMEEFKGKSRSHIGKAYSAVWFGYSQNTHYLERAIPELRKNNMRLVVISNEPYNPPSGYGQIDYKYIPYDYKTIHDEISKCDVAILPDPSTVDTRGSYKSNNKDLTAWACGVPVVKQPDDIQRFMSADERNKEVTLRSQEIKDKWDVKISVDEYKKLLEKIG